MPQLTSSHVLISLSGAPKAPASFWGIFFERIDRFFDGVVFRLPPAACRLFPRRRIIIHMKAAAKQSGRNGRAGQAMLIAVLSLGGAILGATVVAGILTLYELRASTDTANSAKALFAADAGVEWTLFSYYCGSLDTPARCSGPVPLPVLAASGASVTSTCYDANGAVSDCGNTSTTVSAVTLGAANGTKRAFDVSLIGSTSSIP